jgi:hypothetical protein
LQAGEGGGSGAATAMSGEESLKLQNSNTQKLVKQSTNKIIKIKIEIINKMK